MDPNAVLHDRLNDCDKWNVWVPLSEINMRLMGILGLLLAISPEAFAAQSSGKLRMATESEIRQHLQRAGSLKDGADDYQYIEGSSTGYKITDGKICVRKRSAVDCADVLFDGQHLELIDAKGNREIMGN